MEFNDQMLNALLHITPRQTTRQLVTQPDCSHITVSRRLRAPGKVNEHRECSVAIIHQQLGSAIINLSFAFVLTES